MHTISRHKHNGNSNRQWSEVDDIMLLDGAPYSREGSMFLVAADILCVFDLHTECVNCPVQHALAASSSC
jgi:hypothetical protein